MKSSTKVLGTTILAITAVLALGIISSRIYLNSVMGSDYKESPAMILEENETRIFDIKDFSRIDFIGAWEIDINQGSEYRIEVEAPGNLLREVEMDQAGDHLMIRNDFKSAIGADTFTIRITMPELKEVTIAGGAEMDFDGFKGEELAVTLSGAGKIEAHNSEYNELKVICSGAGQLDFTDLKSKNADVNLSGAGEILLNMEGGELRGTISGMGSVEYEGRVSNESVKVSGLGEVSPR